MVGSRWHRNFRVAALESCKNLLSFSLSLASLFSAVLCPLPKLLTVPFLILSDLVAEIHGCQSVNKTVLILETLLSHIERFLHSHCKSHAQSKHKAYQNQNDIQEIYPVRGAARGANKCKLLEVHECVVDKSKEDGSENQEAKIDDHPRYCFNQLVSAFQCQHRCQSRADNCCKYCIALENDAKMSLGPVALLVRLVIQNRFQLEILDKGFAEDLQINYNYGN